MLLGLRHSETTAVPLRRGDQLAKGSVPSNCSAQCWSNLNPERVYQKANSLLLQNSLLPFENRTYWSLFLKN